MSQRSIVKALTDTAEVVAALGIAKKHLIGIHIYRWGEPTVQVKPVEFVRLYNMLRVRRDKREADFDEKGNLHASFTARRTEFRCVVCPGTPEMDALTGQDQPRLTAADETLLIGSVRQLTIDG